MDGASVDASLLCPAGLLVCRKRYGVSENTTGGIQPTPNVAKEPYWWPAPFSRPFSPEPAPMAATRG